MEENNIPLPTAAPTQDNDEAVAFARQAEVLVRLKEIVANVEGHPPEEQAARTAAILQDPAFLKPAAGQEFINACKALVRFVVPGLDIVGMGVGFGVLEMDAGEKGFMLAVYLNKDKRAIISMNFEEAEKMEKNIGKMLDQIKPHRRSKIITTH